MAEYGIVIHGGAGTINPEKLTAQKELEYREALKQSVEIGYEKLHKGGSALDAVESAVKVMEDIPLFNAGKGSVFSHNEKIEMDASIMDGKTLKAGAVAGASGVKNPISLARAVLENSPHTFLIGEGAREFAGSQELDMEPDSYFFTESRYRQLQKAKEKDDIYLDHSGDSKFGTVGAVALDQKGNLAAATSTGGLTNKKWGRVGDSAVIGAGTYANNDTCAVSCTGDGEFFIRGVAAYDLSCLVEYLHLDLQTAGKLLIKSKLVKMGGEGGLIAINRKGDVIMPFNTTGMYRAYKLSRGKVITAIYDS